MIYHSDICKYLRYLPVAALVPIKFAPIIECINLHAADASLSIINSRYYSVEVKMRIITK